jgi:hypothetical protein
VGAYGTDGYALFGWTGASDLVDMPGVSVNLVQGNRHQWAGSTDQVRALENPEETERRAGTLYDSNKVEVRLDFTNAYAGNLHLYSLDWDSSARRQSITVDDGTGAQKASLDSAFGQGAWAHAPIDVPAGGSVTITAERTGGDNAVLAGALLGGEGAPDTAPPETNLTEHPAGSTIELSARFAFTGTDDRSSAAELTFECRLDGQAFAPCTTPQDYADLSLGQHTVEVRAIDQAGNVDGTPATHTWSVEASPLPPADEAPQGDWVGTYGTDGYALFGWNGDTDLVDIPGVSVNLVQGHRYQWADSTDQVQALENPEESQRRAATLYDANKIEVRLDFTEAYAGDLHLYALDWDTTARRQSITVGDGSVVQKVTLNAAFGQGAWVHAPIDVPAGGSVTITVEERTGGDNTVLAGLFLGEPPPPAP